MERQRGRGGGKEREKTAKGGAIEMCDNCLGLYSRS